MADSSRFLAFPPLSQHRFIPSPNFTHVTTTRRKRVVVVHDMEFPERLSAAEEVARYLATTKEAKSAHLCADADSIVRCVRDEDVAWAAPGCNGDGLQLELAGYARQSRTEWLDPFGVAMLDRAGDAVAQWCLAYAIPPRLLSDVELSEGRSGIVGHVQVTRVYGRSDHTDPGPNFPWDYFARIVVDAFRARGGAL